MKRRLPALLAALALGVDPVFAAAAGEPVLAGPAGEAIGAAPTVQDVGAAAPHQRLADPGAREHQAPPAVGEAGHAGGRAGGAVRLRSARNAFDRDPMRDGSRAAVHLELERPVLVAGAAGDRRRIGLGPGGRATRERDRVGSCRAP